MLNTEKIKTWTEYATVGGLVAVSGFPYFMVSQINFFVLFILVTFIYLKRSEKFNFKMLPIVVFFFVVEVLQFQFIKPLDPVMISGTFIRLFLAFFTISIAGKKFSEYYVNILCFFSIISFIFFLPCLFVPGFFNLFTSSICPIFDSPFADKDGYYYVWPTTIIYCFHDCIVQEFRNPGPFWEPGLFSVYINLALIFNLIKEKKLITKKNIVLSLAIFSTFSTAGYMSFFVLVFSFYMVSQPLIKKIIIGAITIPVALTLYFSLDFLSHKVEENVDLAGTTTSSRFGSALADYNDFIKSPIIGWGRGVMRYGGKEFQFFSEDQHRNNSVTDLLATYGIFLFLFYFYNYYKSLKNLCIHYEFNIGFASLGLVVILMCGFSQSIFLKPFFYSILFVHLAFKEKGITEK